MLGASLADKMENTPFCLLFSFWKPASGLNVMAMTLFRRVVRSFWIQIANKIETIRYGIAIFLLNSFLWWFESVCPYKESEKP